VAISVHVAENRGHVGASWGRRAWRGGVAVGRRIRGSRGRRALALGGAIGLIVVGLVAPSPPVGAVPAVPAALASPPIGQLPDLGGTMGWSKVFDEGFDGAAVDESVWTVVEGGGSGPGLRTRQSVGVSGGFLTLRAFTQGGVDARLVDVVADLDVAPVRRSGGGWSRDGRVRAHRPVQR
jgi:hypothetical protein